MAKSKVSQPLNLFHIGNEFYRKSCTMMSSIYEIKTKNRSDWGKVSIALDCGRKVNIRPANKTEMKWANEELKEYLQIIEKQKVEESR